MLTTPDGAATRSHAFAVRADAAGGDEHELARQLRRANLLTSGIGIPGDAAEAMGAIRIGTNEMVRWGMTIADMTTVADVIARAANGADPVTVAADVGRFRRRFDRVHFCH